MLQSLYLNRYSLEGVKGDVADEENKLVLLSRIRTRLAIQTFLNSVCSLPA